MTSKWRPTAQEPKEASPLASSVAPVNSSLDSKPERQVQERSVPVDGQPTYQVEPPLPNSKETYARLSLDVPLTLGSRGGIVVGFVRKGTRVKVLTKPEADTVAIAVPFPSVNRSGTVQTVTENVGGHSPLVVTIETKATAELSKRLRAFSTAGEPEGPRFGLYRELSATPTGPGFAFVKCNKVRILERKVGRQRVVVEYEAGELYGWIDAPRADERDAGCDMGVYPQLPFRYLPVQGEVESVLAQWVQNKSEVFWANRKGETTRCERWVFAPGKEPNNGWLYLEAEGTANRDTTRTERSYGLNRNIVTLGGLVYRQNDAAVVAGGKVDFYAVVRAEKDSLDVVEWESSSSTPEQKLLGYRANAAKTWYLSRAACESGLTKSSSTRPVADASGI
jgi:hypothetical protein